MTQIIYPQGRKIGGWLKRRKSKCRLFTQKATEFYVKKLTLNGPKVVTIFNQTLPGNFALLVRE